MTSPEGMRDHWWWRPGWKVGRSFYTWHATFEASPGASALVDHYAPLLEQFPGLDPVGISGLHLTMQGLGFADEVTRDDAELIASHVHSRLSDAKPFTVRIGPAHVDPETVQMAVSPLDGFTKARTAIREAIGDVWGEGNVPEKAEGFHPHVTLAYSNSAGSSVELDAALKAFPPLSQSIEVKNISLIDLNRDSKRYEWTELTKVDLEG